MKQIIRFIDLHLNDTSRRSNRVGRRFLANMLLFLQVIGIFYRAQVLPGLFPIIRWVLFRSPWLRPSLCGNAVVSVGLIGRSDFEWFSRAFDW
jgi:hypothetical protein